MMLSDEIQKDFLGTKCAICARPKRKGFSFCSRCYYFLPEETKEKLVNAIIGRALGAEYERIFLQAYAQAEANWERIRRSKMRGQQLELYP